MFLRSLLLLKKLEGALLGNIASLLQLLQGLEARGVLLLGYNAALASLHQILLGQATGSVLGRSVKHLGLRARSHHSASHLDILACLSHFYTQYEEIKTLRAWEPFQPKSHQ